jgi:hypothetical protein
MRSFAITFVFFTSLCFAAQCPDPRLRQAVIGGETINGSVVLHQKPLKSAQLRLYFSIGKTAWVGMTDKDGTFRISQLRPDTYRLDVRGWGSATIRLNPDLNKLANGQIPVWSVQLMEDKCVGTTTIIDWRELASF